MYETTSQTDHLKQIHPNNIPQANPTDCLVCEDTFEGCKTSRYMMPRGNDNKIQPTNES